MSSLLCYFEILPVLQNAVSSIASQPDIVLPLNPHTTSWHLHSIMLYKDLCTCLLPTDLKVPETSIISYNFVFHLQNSTYKNACIYTPSMCTELKDQQLKVAAASPLLEFDKNQTLFLMSILIFTGKQEPHPSHTHQLLH